MAEFPLSDPLLAELWRARPDGPDRLADEAAGVALLERLVSTDPNASNEVVPNLVGFGGGPPPDACQLVGVRASTKTHERKVTTTNDEEKATRRAGPEA